MTILGIILLLLPFIATWVVLVRLAPHRRDGRGLVGILLQWPVHALRPDLYTDEGQRFLPWRWGVTIATIPWVLFIANIFLR